jgi:hypothetical protein
MALEAAKALAVVGNARGWIEAAVTAAKAAVSERDAGLEASIREERRLREQASAMHEQRLALTAELSASEAARAALVDELAELRTSHARAEAEHARQLEELKKPLSPCHSPDRLVERVERARAANSVRSLSLSTSSTAPARTAPLSPSDCAIEPVSSGLEAPVSGGGVAVLSCTSVDDAASVASSLDGGRGGVTPRELRNGSSNGLTHGRRWADSMLASNALSPVRHDMLSPGSHAPSPRGHAGATPHPDEPGAQSPLGTAAEVRQELQARNNALRAMGKRLLGLRDQLQQEEKARKAAEAQSHTLRGELERARSEAVDALCSVQKLGQQLADARAVADAISGVDRPESNGARSRGGPARESCGGSETPWRSVERTSTVRRRLSELQRALHARAREVHAAASHAASKAASHAGAHASSYWGGVPASAAWTEAAASCAAAVASAARLEDVVRIEVEAMSTLLEREETEHAQTRTALLQALQDKAVAERVQASLMSSFDISKMFTAAAALATPGRASSAASPPPTPPPPPPPPRAPTKASSEPVMGDLVDQLKRFDRAKMRRVGERLSSSSSASPRGLAPPKDFVEELKRGLPRLRSITRPPPGRRAAAGAGELAGDEAAPRALTLGDSPLNSSGDGAEAPPDHSAAADTWSPPTAAGRGEEGAMVASAGAEGFVGGGREGARHEGTDEEATADAAAPKTDDADVASPRAASSRRSNDYDGDYF